MRLLHNPPPEQISTLFTRLRQDGCDAVAIIPHHYVSLEPGTANLAPPPPAFKIPWFIYPDVGQDPDHPYHNTPEPEVVLAACQAAARLGLRVLLKPHIDSYAAAWRGFISVQARTADWVWSYRQRFLARYLDIARQVDGTILSLGCELYTVSKELGSEFWIGLAAWARRQGFQGPLTYAANWGWADDAEYRRLYALWAHLDYIGVDSYFPLVPAGYRGTLDTNTLAAGWHRRGIDAAWCPRIDDDLLALSRQTGRPLLFTEIGYGNHRRAAEDPGGEARPDDVRDDALQARLAQAFQQRWSGAPELAGYFWWEAALDQTAKQPISHDILGQPVEQIVFRPPVEGSGAVPPAPLPVVGIAGQVPAIHGLHAPNSRFADFRSRPDGPAEGAEAVWERVRLAEGRWLKLLWPDHGRTDAAAAQAHGLHVLVRAPGADSPHWEDVQQMITELRGVCEVIEVGNEPFPTPGHPHWDDLLWNHAWYLEAVWDHCAAAAHAAGILLCAPGWRAATEPPTPGAHLAGGADQAVPPLVVDQALAARLRQVYSAYDAIAVHCYDPFDLDLDPVFARIARWQQAFGKPVYVTEYGIAARSLPGAAPAASDLLKAQRYARFVQRLAGLDQVRAAFLFIVGGTNDFAAFNGGGYDPQGENSYWISKEAYALLGQTLAGGPTPAIAAAGLAPSRRIGWNDRPHGPDFPMVSAPTISPAVFAAWLQGHHSPALAEADALTYYQAVLQRGINPAMALAFFHHESQCGTDPGGVVVRYQTKNWGNLRPGQDGSIGRASGRTPQTDWGVFRRYSSWLAGLLDWCDLWFIPLYRGKSLREALVDYAPPGDHNNPQGYAATVLGLLAQWDQESGAFDLPDAAPERPADYPLLGAASIRWETFRDTLLAAHSPTLEEADSIDYYRLCTSNGVDPAVALAFFGQETAYGTQPGATANQNWANLWDAAQHCTAVFPTWVAGLREMCTRWQAPPFTDGGPPTVASIVPHHRGARPDNVDYIREVNDRMAALHTADLSPVSANGLRPGVRLLDLPALARAADVVPAGAGLAAPIPGRSPLAEWIGTEGTNPTAVNIDVGRAGHQPRAVVIHVMMGNMQGTIDAFQNPKHQASAHYGVSKQGRIVQFVNDDDTAWANGILYDPNLNDVPWLAGVQQRGEDPNTDTISIEWEGAHGDGKWISWQGQPWETLQRGSVTLWWVPSDEQYQAGLRLIRDLCARNQIPLDGDLVQLRARICLHSDFDNGKKWFCPGQGFPLARLLNDLRATGQPDYPLLGAASIRWETFRDTLLAAHSPTLEEADSIDYYRLCTSNGVDPAVALAFFGQETAYGTQPGATANQNWANLWDAAQHCTAVFPIWVAGLREMCTRWQAPPFTDGGPPTVASIVPHHRGARPDNVDYISEVNDRITTLLNAAAAGLGAATLAATPAGGTLLAVRNR